MTSSTLTSDISAPARDRDRARPALRTALPVGRIGWDVAASRAQRADRLARVRADRNRRRATARQFAAYPATRSAAGVVLPRGLDA